LGLAHRVRFPGIIKGGPLCAGLPGFVVSGYRTDQGEERSPIAVARATACVRLCTPSLP
jgi:hypothetical protein